MIYTLVAVKDRGIEAYQPLQSVRHPQEAIRGFIDALKNPQSGTMYKHPDDFDLYQIGTFDDSTGAIETHTPVKLGDGKQLSQLGE